MRRSFVPDPIRSLTRQIGQTTTADAEGREGLLWLLFGGEEHAAGFSATFSGIAPGKITSLCLGAIFTGRCTRGPGSISCGRYSPNPPHRGQFSLRPPQEHSGRVAVFLTLLGLHNPTVLGVSGGVPGPAWSRQ